MLVEQFGQDPQVVPAGRNTRHDVDDPRGILRHLRGQHRREPLDLLDPLDVGAGPLGAAVAARVTGLVARIRAPGGSRPRAFTLLSTKPSAKCVPSPAPNNSPPYAATSLPPQNTASTASTHSSN